MPIISISIYFMTQCNITNYRKLCKPYENLYLLNYILSCKYISFRFFKNYNTPTFLRAFFLASMTVHNLSIVSAILFVFCLSINISVKVESKVLPISSKPMLFKSALLSSTQLIPSELCFSSLSFRSAPSRSLLAPLSGIWLTSSWSEACKSLLPSHRPPVHSEFCSL